MPTVTISRKSKLIGALPEFGIYSGDFRKSSSTKLGALNNGETESYTVSTGYNQFSVNPFCTENPCFVTLDIAGDCSFQVKMNWGGVWISKIRGNCKVLAGPQTTRKEGIFGMISRNIFN
eukprot:TRINITY_DN7314_c0_g1_i1.p1 TRINITY_DN7314_c0_g1~~TRINITY_DN7314_c0_g1_i1.p1  ORF type:complete len:120 (+),score=2.35 TRINITY_DN7314_c0_g1_i1:420-779(+)